MLEIQTESMEHNFLNNIELGERGVFFSNTCDHGCNVGHFTLEFSPGYIIDINNIDIYLFIYLFIHLLLASLSEPTHYLRGSAVLLNIQGVKNRDFFV